MQPLTEQKTRIFLRDLTISLQCHLFLLSTNAKHCAIQYILRDEANNGTYSMTEKDNKNRGFLSRCTDLLGKGMVGGGLGTVGIGMGRGPVPGMWTPPAVKL